MNHNSLIRRDLFPSQEPRAQRRLRVSSRHELYIEECGAPDGLPAIALHGGPGGGISPEIRRFFDPARYRVILFDQRGCGKSTPHAELAENTTWDLVADIERIREQAGIDKWVVFGGSWGSTLALAYAAAHPERVLGIVLRGIFLLTESEVRWFYQEGASRLFPDAFEPYQAAIPPEERGDMVSAFYNRLTNSNQAVRVAAARAWTRWEGDTISFEGPSARPSRFNEDHFAEAFARIECHYFVHKGFFESDGWLLKAAPRFEHIPGVIVHGRYDVVTPLSSAYALSKVWPKAELKIIPDAGHSSLEPGVTDALIRATEAMADRFYKKPA